MKATSDKIENSVVDRPELAQPPELAPAAPDLPVELAEENSFNRNPDRKLYRRSVAYFFFGFGSKKHSIVTDES